GSIDATNYLDFAGKALSNAGLMVSTSGRNPTYERLPSLDFILVAVRSGGVSLNGVDNTGTIAATAGSTVYLRGAVDTTNGVLERSEERRVGKECRSGGAGCQYTNTMKKVGVSGSKKKVRVSGSLREYVW